MRKAAIKAAIWDLDDILVDTKSFQRTAQQKALRTVTVPNDQIAHCVSIWDRLLWFFDQEDYIGILRAIVSELDLNVSDGLIEYAAKAADDVWNESIPVVQGVEHCLEYLLNYNILLGVVSNGRETEQHKKLIDANLHRFFGQDAVIISKDSRDRKPNPSMLLEFCRLHSVDPAQAIYIGDRVTDVIAANLAGTTSILIPRDAPENKEPPTNGKIGLEIPTHYLNSYDELFVLLRKMLFDDANDD